MCPGCGRTLSVHDFALDADGAAREKHERDGVVGMVVCIGIAVAASLAAAGEMVPPIVAGGAWVLAFASMGPRAWAKVRYRGRQLYQEDLEDGYSLEKNPRLRR